MKSYYCKKCGRIIYTYHDDIQQKCDCCNSIMELVPKEYLSDSCLLVKKENLLIEELVKTSPEFDQYLFDHRDEILANKSAEFQNKIEVGQALLQGKQVSRQEILSGKLNDSTKYNSPQCPTCKSYNVRKISGVERAGSVWTFGIFSKKINKSFKCNNCGYTW